MTTRTKTPVESKTYYTYEDGVPADDVPTSYTHWMRRVMETMLDSEQKWLELATAQNDLALKALKQGAEFLRTAPGLPVTEGVRRSEERFMNAQQRWVDTTTYQRERVLREMQRAERETEGTPTPNFKTLADFARQQIEGLIVARNRWLDFVAKQNDLFIQGIEETLSVKESTPTASRARLVEETVDNYLEVQKRLLDAITPVTPVTPVTHVTHVTHVTETENHKKAPHVTETEDHKKAPSHHKKPESESTHTS